MSKFVISGYYGFANAGDEAMLTAIVKALRLREPEAAITVISGRPEVTAVKHRVASIHRFDFLKIIYALIRSDLLLSGGGSLLQDVTSRRSLLYYLFILFLGRLLGKRVMLYAQGIGPISSPFLRSLTRRILAKADAITVRDEDSLSELVRLGLDPASIQVTADAVFTLPAEDVGRGAKLLRAFGIEKGEKLIGVNVRQWQQEEAHLKSIARAADVLAHEAGAKVVLLPLQYPADVAPCRRLKQLLSVRTKSVILDRDFSTEDFLAVIGNFHLLIAMRLHALIFAALMKTPFVAVDYDPKIEAFAKLAGGYSGGKVDELDSDILVAAAGEALRQGAAGEALAAKLRAKAMANAELALQLAQRSGKA